MKMIKIEKPKMSFITKLEGDEEIRGLLTKIFEENMVKARMTIYISRIMATVEFIHTGELISDKDMEFMDTEEFWKQKAKSEMYLAIVGAAVEKHFYVSKSWDIREDIIKLIKEEITPESMVEAIERIELKFVKMFREQLWN